MQIKNYYGKDRKNNNINKVAPSSSSRERNNPTPLSTKQKVNNTFSNFLLLFLKNMVIYTYENFLYYFLTYSNFIRSSLFCTIKIILHYLKNKYLEF